MEDLVESSKVRISGINEKQVTYVYFFVKTQFQMTYDATGCFHWCTSRTMEECSLTRQEATVTMFSGHIIVAIFAEPDSPLLGLRY